MERKFVNIHMLVSHSPSCLNRDDMNMQKSAVFGGTRRVRISSQCAKRAIRSSLQYEKFFGKEGKSVRTADSEKLIESIKALFPDVDNNILEFVVKKLAIPKEKVVTAWTIEEAMALVDGVKGVLNDKGYASSALTKLSALYDAENKVVKAEEDEADEGDGSMSKKNKEIRFSKEQKKENETLKKTIDATIKKIEEDFMKSGISSVDLALSGRMCASSVLKNVEAAMSMAHAITTHAMDAEIDWFTAMDDLKEDAEEVGAGHLNTQEFGAGVFYQYASIDIDSLAKNMGRDRKNVLDVVSKFIYLMATTVPSGKQHSFASHSLAHYIMVSFSDLPLSMANAFENPVKKDYEGFLKPSIKAIENYWSKIHKAYGLEEPTAVFSIDSMELNTPLVKRVETIKELQNWIKEGD